MKKILLLVSLAISNISFAQTHIPSKKETANYITSKILSFGPDQDPSQSYYQLKFDDESCALTIKYYQHSIIGTFNEDCYTSETVYFSNLDANSISWDIINSSKTLTMTLVSPNGGFVTLKGKLRPNGSYYAGRFESKVIFYFSVSKVSENSDFQGKFERAVKNLIELCGGSKEEEDPFEK
ncbi:MAG: hypothetical protein JNK41_00405 [Saprospiraceae bacterium]|nr:hypothetical protein [Saprospiraceae bacterium]